ncbi:hypothetical protein BLA9940_05219 [Burkholderia aenigmatica]|uniref:hypothetical protein n=2 Tax=Burkholderiaceae TaxID=119060 RepID=UPI0013DE5215|nr:MULTISPECIES: hypothetical protein [Burkholderia cepacia complex]VWC87298.1 hypothetical protein BLA9940_05219 [Burkholderia aenigmatica]
MEKWCWHKRNKSGSELPAHGQVDVSETRLGISKLLASMKLLAIFVISGCVSLSVDEVPIRSQGDFLRDIKSVVDSNDLTNADMVGKKLRVDFYIREDADVWNISEQNVSGHRVERGVTRQAKEYGDRSQFDYGVFYPKNGDPTRVLMGFQIETGRICMTKIDVVDVFGVGERDFIKYGNEGVTYNPSGNGLIRISFRFGFGGCLSRVGLNQGVLMRP